MEGGRSSNQQWALPEDRNYAVKSSFLLGFLESVPELKSVEQAAALVLVY